MDRLLLIIVINAAMPEAAARMNINASCDVSSPLRLAPSFEKNALAYYRNVYVIAESLYA
jgi:hypothetical protein